MNRRERIVTYVVYLATLVLAMGFSFSRGYGRGLEDRTVLPSQVLGFTPVWETSDPYQIAIVQAELARNGIECKVDSDFGKETAIGICQLLAMLEDGYDRTVGFEVFEGEQ